jgi:hypothetical protein
MIKSELTLLDHFTMTTGKETQIMKLLTHTPWISTQLVANQSCSLLLERVGEQTLV